VLGAPITIVTAAPHDGETALTAVGDGVSAAAVAKNDPVLSMAAGVLVFVVPMRRAPSLVRNDLLELGDLIYNYLYNIVN
jgi:hypothetical protein